MLEQEEEESGSWQQKRGDRKDRISVCKQSSIRRQHLHVTLYTAVASIITTSIITSIISSWTWFTSSVCLESHEETELTQTHEIQKN